MEDLRARLEEATATGTAFRRLVVEELGRLPGYDSVFYYALDGDTLVLEHFVGEPTEHERISVGRGVCGSAVAEGRNRIVADVEQEENYLCCSAKTRSEIVVLVRAGGEIVGQIDVDGHAVGTFGPRDETLLEEVAALIAQRL